MPVISISIIAHLIVIFCALISMGTGDAKAATTPPTPDFNTPKENLPPATAEEIDRARQVQITEPPPLKIHVQERDYFYPYRQALTVRGGALIDSNQTNTLGSNMGFLYRFPFDNSQRIEVGADLLNEGVGVLHASRFFFTDDDRFRWLYKYGIGIRVVPSQQLVTFLKLANWQARAGGGFDWTISNPYSLRVDVEAAISSEKISAIASFGLAYGW